MVAMHKNHDFPIHALIALAVLDHEWYKVINNLQKNVITYDLNIKQSFHCNTHILQIFVRYVQCLMLVVGRKSEGSS